MYRLCFWMYKKGLFIVYLDVVNKVEDEMGLICYKID